MRDFCEDQVHLLIEHFGLKNVVRFIESKFNNVGSKTGQNFIADNVSKCQHPNIIHYSKYSRGEYQTNEMIGRSCPDCGYNN